MEHTWQRRVPVENSHKIESSSIDLAKWSLLCSSTFFWDACHGTCFGEAASLTSIQRSVRKNREHNENQCSTYMFCPGMVPRIFSWDTTWRVEGMIESEQRSISEWIVSVPKCPSTRPDVLSVVVACYWGPRHLWVVLWRVLLAHTGIGGKEKQTRKGSRPSESEWSTSIWISALFLISR